MDPHPPCAETASVTQAHRYALGYLVFSGLSVACGAAVMMAAGLNRGLWLRNPVAWIVALAAWRVLARRARLPAWTLGVLVAILAATFLGTGQQGVHRWIGFGAVQMNAAALVLPLALAWAGRGGHAGFAAWMAAAAIILAWQPDLSQLGALLAALLAWAAMRRDTRALLWIVPTVVLALILCALRPDPLQPVAHVEGIFQLAWTVSPLFAVAAGASLLLTALSPLVLAADAGRRPQAVALSTYFLVSSLAWCWGAFPVPLLGYGISYVIGWSIGGAALLMWPTASKPLS